MNLHTTDEMATRIAEMTDADGFLKPQFVHGVLDRLRAHHPVLAAISIIATKSLTGVIPKIRFSSPVLQSSSLQSSSDIDSFLKSSDSHPSFVHANVSFSCVPVTGSVVIAADDGVSCTDIIDRLALCVANDLVELVMCGDPSSVDPFLKLTKGIFAQANQRIDVRPATLRSETIARMVTAIPPEFRNGPKMFVDGIGAAVLDESSSNGDISCPVPNGMALLTPPSNVGLVVWNRIGISMNRVVDQLVVTAEISVDVKLIESAAAVATRIVDSVDAPNVSAG